MTKANRQNRTAIPRGKRTKAASRRPPNLHFNLIRRLVMCGDGNPLRRDFPAGSVFGILNLDEYDPVFDWAEVGSYSGDGRRLPSHD